VRCTRLNQDVLREHGCEAVLSFTSTGIPENEASWTTPDELERAANTLSELVERSDPTVQALLRAHEPNAIGSNLAPVEFGETSVRTGLSFLYEWNFMKGARFGTP
jgi:hypothetical protein